MLSRLYLRRLFAFLGGAIVIMMIQELILLLLDPHSTPPPNCGREKGDIIIIKLYYLSEQDNHNRQNSCQLNLNDRKGSEYITYVEQSLKISFDPARLKLYFVIQIQSSVHLYVVLTCNGRISSDYN